MYGSFNRTSDSFIHKANRSFKGSLSRSIRYAEVTISLHVLEKGLG